MIEEYAKEFHEKLSGLKQGQCLVWRDCDWIAEESKEKASKEDKSKDSKGESMLFDIDPRQQFLDGDWQAIGDMPEDTKRIM